MKIAVCELLSDLLPGSPQWKRFAARVAQEAPEMLLLNEMPFGPWLAAASSPLKDWIIDPCGEVVGQTRDEAPLVCHELDLAIVAQAQREYPNYVLDHLTPTSPS